MQVFKRKKKKRSIIIRTIVVVVLLCGFVNMLYVFVQQRLTIAERQKEYDRLEEKIEDQVLENDELRSIVEDEDLSAYMEKIARESLNYAYPGEQVYINVAGVD